MKRSLDLLLRFRTLQRQLHAERKQVKVRLAAIEQVLGTATTKSVPPVHKQAPRKGAQTRRPTGSKLTMRDAIRKATASKPLSIGQLVQRMPQLGFVFTSKNPVNSVGAYLYGKQGRAVFKRINGAFQPR